MPQLTHILSRNPSITYTNAFVPNSLCCPSRTSTLTGDYSHTTGVFGNGGEWGGFMSFTAPPEGNSISAVNDSTTMGVDMQNAGYRTALIGKYLNGYPFPANLSYVPPGWNRWFSIKTASYYHYIATLDGSELQFGRAPNDYSTRVLFRQARGFIGQPRAIKPFFLYYATTAPHGPATPDPRDVGRFNLDGYVEPPSFGVAEAGAPDYIENRTWDSTSVTRVDSLHAKQLDAAYGVDRSIGQIWNLLPANTVVLFMSDNGFMWGEHKWVGKEIPYNESVRVPIMLVGKDLQTPLPTGHDPCAPRSTRSPPAAMPASS